MKKSLLYDIIVIVIILQFLSYFSLRKIPVDSPLRDQAKILVGIFLAVVAIRGLLFQNEISFKPLDKKVLCFIFTMVLSSVCAYAFWNQSFIASMKGYVNFYIYFLYFILLIFNFSIERVERIIKIFFFLSLVVFIVDLVTIPESLFSYRNEERRNGITIWFEGQGFTFLGGFYFLNKFFYEKKPYQLGLFIVAASCLFLLTQSRMNLLALVLGFFFLLLCSEGKKKYLIAILFSIVGVCFYQTSGMFNGIKEASSDQSEFAKEDIRVLAQSYYLHDLQGGIPTMIFGNGVPAGNTDLGIATTKANLMGFWTADIGLTGIFSYFGLLGVIVWLTFFYSVFKIKNHRRSNYLKAYFITLLTTAFTGFSIFDPGYMPSTILALYLVSCQVQEAEMDTFPPPEFFPV
jgi:hypothetical protein